MVVPYPRVVEACVPRSVDVHGNYDTLPKGASMAHTRLFGYLQHAIREARHSHRVCLNAYAALCYTFSAFLSFRNYIGVPDYACQSI